MRKPPKWIYLYYIVEAGGKEMRARKPEGKFDFSPRYYGKEHHFNIVNLQTFKEIGWYRGLFMGKYLYEDKESQRTVVREARHFVQRIALAELKLRKNKSKNVKEQS